MMKKARKILGLAIIVFSLFTTSCTKEGPAGPCGPAGEDGNTNVIVRTIAPFPAWESGFYLGAPANFIDIEEPLLNKESVDNTLVLVFFQLFGGSI